MNSLEIVRIHYNLLKIPVTVLFMFCMDIILEVGRLPEKNSKTDVNI